MTADPTGEGTATFQVAVLPETLSRLADKAGAAIVRREPVRVWSQSGVERVWLGSRTLP